MDLYEFLLRLAGIIIGAAFMLLGTNGVCDRDGCNDTVGRLLWALLVVFGAVEISEATPW